MHRLGQGARPSRAARADDLGGVRGRAAEAHSLSRPLRRLPCAAGLGVEDLPGPVRQQQILGERQRGRPPRRHPRLRRSHRDPPGRAHRGGTSPLLRPRRRRSTIPGITCRFWRASRALCATARRSRTGCCRRRWTACGASSPGPTTATGRWSKSSPPCSPTDCRRWRPPALQALSEGVHSADVVINILARQRDPGPAATILTPDALRLRHAPIADCARYDQLRSA